MTKRVVVPARQAGNIFLGSLKGLQLRARLYIVGLLYRPASGLRNGPPLFYAICGFRMQPCSILRSYRLTLCVNYFLWSIFILPGGNTSILIFVVFCTVRMRVCRLATVDYSKFTIGNPMPESTLFPSKGLRIWPQVSGMLFKRRRELVFPPPRTFPSWRRLTSLKAEMSEIKTKSHSSLTFNWLV